VGAFIILFAVIFGGGLLYFLFNKRNDSVLKLSLSFSGAYLLGITVTHLIPEVYSSNSGHIGVFILAGFIFQILLEFFSEGIEHGHIHVHKKHSGVFPFTMMFSLCVHSFFEGIPMADVAQRQSLMMGIAMHHVPVAFALMSMLLQSGVNRKWALFSLFLFAVMSPIGAFTGIYLGDWLQNGLFEKVMAVVIGIFLHISTTILFESDSDHRFNIIKLIIILGGAGLSLMV
jgi:zinc transporter ZupT